MQILLHALGHREPNEPETIWVDAIGNARFSLAVLLSNFWCAAAPNGVDDGKAVAVRFADELGNPV